MLENFHDYSQKSIDDFKLIISNPSPKLTDQENQSVINSFDSSSLDKFIETNRKRILDHVLRHLIEDNSIAHPSTCALNPAESVSLKICLIKLK